MGFVAKSNLSDWKDSFRGRRNALLITLGDVMRETATEIVEEGRQDIAAAGFKEGRTKFGLGWQSGLQFRMEDKGTKAVIFHRIKIASLFEFGGTIAGKPLLWIPTKPGIPPARMFRRKLTSATVRGTPVLFDAEDRDRHRRPLYIGVPEVHIPRKWHLREIAEKVLARAREIFDRLWKAAA